jgi:predicted enzyme related to lactoylglutathione lyase
MNQKKILGLRTCIYKVPDLTKAKAWYGQAFAVSPYFDEPFYVGFNVAGYELGLQPGEAGTSDNVLTYWGVEDVQAAFGALVESGAKPHEEPHNVGGDIVVASVHDPWGNVIGLIYNPSFSLEDPPVH